MNKNVTNKNAQVQNHTITKVHTSKTIKLRKYIIEKLIKVKIAKYQKCQIIELQIYNTAKLHYPKL